MKCSCLWIMSHPKSTKTQTWRLTRLQGGAIRRELVVTIARQIMELCNPLPRTRYATSVEQVKSMPIAQTPSSYATASRLQNQHDNRNRLYVPIPIALHWPILFFFFVLQVTMPGQNLALKFPHVVVPKLSSLAVERTRTEPMVSSCPVLSTQ